VGSYLSKVLYLGIKISNLYFLLATVGELRQIYARLVFTEMKGGIYYFFTHFSISYSFLDILLISRYRILDIILLIMVKV
jgi:hypothetical protein